MEPSYRWWEVHRPIVAVGRRMPAVFMSGLRWRYACFALRDNVEMADDGYVYVLHNCWHQQPSVKIGRTRADVRRRARQLDGTGSPGAFTPLFSVRVSDCRRVEQVVSELLAEYRIRPNREFFRVGPELAIRTLLSAAAPFLIEPVLPDKKIDILPRLLDLYDGLLDPNLRSAIIEVDKGVVSLATISGPRKPYAVETIERRDLSWLDGPYEINPEDLDETVDSFLTVDPCELQYSTPFFREPEGTLVVETLETFPGHDHIYDAGGREAVSMLARELREGAVQPEEIPEALTRLYVPTAC
jgi:hypothetical protein